MVTGIVQIDMDSLLCGMRCFYRLEQGNQARTVSSSSNSAPATRAQLQPLSSRTIAFARRAIRCSARPSRAIAVNVCRSASERKPPRIMNPSRIDAGCPVKHFSGSQGVAVYQDYHDADYCQNNQI